jgi:hypothetical protein
MTESWQKEEEARRQVFREKEIVRKEKLKGKPLSDGMQKTLEYALDRHKRGLGVEAKNGGAISRCNALVDRGLFLTTRPENYQPHKYQNPDGSYQTYFLAEYLRTEPVSFELPPETLTEKLDRTLNLYEFRGSNSKPIEEDLWQSEHLLAAMYDKGFRSFEETGTRDGLSNPLGHFVCSFCQITDENSVQTLCRVRAKKRPMARALAALEALQAAGMYKDR